MLIYSEYPKNSIDISLDFCGFEDCPPGYQYGPDIRELYVLHYIAKGKGTYYFQDKAIDLKQGDLFLLRPDEMTTYQADKEDPWSYYWLGIGGRKAKEYFSYSRITETNYITEEIDKTHAISNIISKTLDYTNKMNKSNGQSEMFYLRMVYSVLYELSNTFPSKSFPILTDPTFTLSQLAKQIIEKRYNENLTIQNIAEELSISRSYLSNNFKKHYQISPKGYLMEVRMERAKQLLEITNEPMNIIGISIGYLDSLYFSRAFKKYFGLSPSEYRKSFTN